MFKYSNLFVLNVSCVVFHALSSAVCAQQNILSWDTVITSDQSDSTAVVGTAIPSGSNTGYPAVTSVDVTYENSVRQVSTINLNSGSYQPILSPLSVILRRAGINAKEIYWSSINTAVGDYTVSGTSATATLRASEMVDMATALGSGNVNIGTDNIFANNGASLVDNDNNIERADFLWTAGMSFDAGARFAIFERGGNDSFKVAPVLSLDAFGNPSSYGNLLSVNSGWGTDLELTRTLVFRGGLVSDVTVPGAQGIRGLAFGAAGFGLTPGTTIYGYSLFGADTTGTGNNLVDWTNTSFYPRTTSETNGGLDVLGYGQFFQPVPEPSVAFMAGWGAFLC